LFTGAHIAGPTNDRVMDDVCVVFSLMRAALEQSC